MNKAFPFPIFHQVSFQHNSCLQAQKFVLMSLDFPEETRTYFVAFLFVSFLEQQIS